MRTHRTSLAFVATLVLAFASGGRADVTDPHITAWHTARTYARVYETTSDKTSGNAVSTWPRSGLTNGGGGQATAVYADIQRVVYSNNYVYVYATGLASYTMGNWLTPNGATYTSWPTNLGAIHRIPRNPSIPTTKQKTNGNGGLLLNGVYVWANGDAQSYNTSTATVSMSGSGIWNRLAGVAENFNFDPGKGHQPSSGAYHNHINPIALRYQLGDNVTYNSSTKAYAEATTLTKHSPLIGWANDGLPIYGPYGYSSALDSTSGIRRMTSGFQKRDGTNGTVNLATTGRVTLPVWAASVQGKSQTLASTEYGPATTATYQVAPNVTGTYSIGIFAEDYEYLGDLGKTQGVDFDLNRQNVRYCVTPEYPSGTYAYFVCIDSSGNTVFPDIIGQEYYGTAAIGSGTVNSITETVTEYARGGQAAALTLTAATDPSGVKLTWPSVEGATYSISSSANGSAYTTLAASVASSGGSTTEYTTATVTAYYKVTLTAVATYDTTGNGGVSGVNTFATTNYTGPPTAPVITADPVSKSVFAGASVTFSVTATGTAPFTYQWFRGATPVGTSATYTINSAAASDAGDYSVIVTNSADSATSATAKLTVTTQPTAQTATAGGSATFSVTSSGTDTCTYQWLKAGSPINGQTSASYQIDPVTSTDDGLYSVAVTNSVGTITSSSVQLTVIVPPAITLDPASKSVFTGAKVTFSVTATGTAPFTYQWFQGANLVGTSATYTINSVAAGNAGDYSVIVTNAANSATSTAAKLTVSTQPAAQSVLAGGSVTLSVTSSGTDTCTYQWLKDGSPISGATSANYPIDPVAFTDAGLYSVAITNSGGTITSSSARLTVNVPAPVALSFANPLSDGTHISTTLAAGGTTPGLVYKSAGLPAGLTLDSSTGALTGTLSAKPATYTFYVWTEFGTTISVIRTVTLTVTAFPITFAGSYEAILTDTGSSPVGKVAIKVTSKGVVSGTLTTAADAKSFKWKGKLALADDNITGTADFTISRGKVLSPYTLNITLPGTPDFTCTLSNGATPLGSSIEGARLKVYPKTQVAPQAGRYTIALGSPQNLVGLSAPEGSGYALATISNAGVLKVTGKLSDGSALSGSFSPDETGTYRCFVKPKAIAGAKLAGWLTPTIRADDSSRYEAASWFYWVKPATSDKVYSAGFGPVKLSVAMQKWVVPTDEAGLPDCLGFNSSGGAFDLSLTGGDVASYALPTSLDLSATGLLTVSGANPSGLKVTVKSATGALSGTFLLEDATSSRKVALQGVLLQLPAADTTTAFGQGYFLLAPKVSTDTTLSGNLEFTLP